jgi:hypothetical protein
MASVASLKWRAMLAPVALASSFAFVLAANYCNLEALSAYPPQSESSDHHHSAGDHHNSAVPTSGDEESLCCAALYAVPGSKLETSPSLSIHRIELQAAKISGHDVIVIPPRSAISWSPPERGPTPATPFYRMTYANHAPDGLSCLV